MRTIEVDSAILGCGIVGSYVAYQLRRAGERVALIDRAPAPGRSPSPPEPVVVAGSRPHQGITDARHHELGGNSAYWGGAMLRIPPADLPDIVDSATITPADLGIAYGEVERVLGIPAPTRRVAAFPGAPDLASAVRTHACVLPSRTKHFFDSLVRPWLHEHEALFDVSISELETGADQLRSIVVEDREGNRTRVVARRFFLTMGVIDSLLFARTFETTLFGEVPSALGRYLHEHVSVPLFRITAESGGDFLRTWVPQFRGRYMNVPRLEFAIDGPWNARAFLHFVFDFDSVGVYRDIKQLMAARQAGAALPQLAMKALGLAPRALDIARIGVDRFLSRRLFVSDDVPVSAVLDFESFPHPDNRLDPGSGAAALHWDIRAEDRASFRQLVPLASRIIHMLGKEHGFTATGPVDFSDHTACDAYLLAQGKDILHLGGGLTSTGGAPVLRPDLTFERCRNLSCVSTAVLRRGSVVNPTHALLALAQWRLAHQSAAA